jgi:hypothetical protein
VRDEPRDVVTNAERAELDALRGRAYGPDADIADDPQAIARLTELEDRVRPARTWQTDISSLGSWADAAAEPVPASAPAGAPAAMPPAAVLTAPTRTAQWHGKLVAGTAVAAGLVG